MAKGLRSKIKKRHRGLRREYIDQIKTKPETEEINSRCMKGLAGIEYREKEKKNAFLFPEDPEAHFPQFKPRPLIDLRSASIPGSGYEWSGARRKKEVVVQHLDEVQPQKKKDEDDEMREEEGVVKIEKGENGMAEQGKATAKKRKRVSKLRKTIVF